MEIDQAALENLEQALAGVDFSALQYFEERIPAEERLEEPLQPKPYKPKPRRPCSIEEAI